MAVKSVVQSGKERFGGGFLLAAVVVVEAAWAGVLVYLGVRFL